VLADWAIDESTLAAVTGKIERTLHEEIRPMENWGWCLISPSEQFGRSRRRGVGLTGMTFHEELLGLAGS
jgi:hypothetical protein